VGRTTNKPSMTAAELGAAGQAIYGAQWVRPLARAIGYNYRTVRFWKNSGRRIPEAAAAKIRSLCLIGPVGVVIRRAVWEIVPDAGPWAAHKVAQQAVLDLVKAGLLEEDP
jgi:hypothetical protein